MRYLVEGGNLLSGTIKVQGSKNGALALLSSAIITRSKIRLTNIPHLLDIDNFLSLSQNLGVTYNFKNNVLDLDATRLHSAPIDKEISSKLRASSYFLSILASLKNDFDFYETGGCKLGPRPLDYHLLLLEAFGVSNKREEGLLHFTVGDLHSTTISLPFPSFGATINALLLASTLEGVTTLINVAREPEIKEVINFLKQKGVDITDLDDHLLIKGCETFNEHASYQNISDRIAASSYLVLGALIGERLKITNISLKDLSDILSLFDEAEISYELSEEMIVIDRALCSAKIKLVAEPYPGFSTDILPLIVPLFIKGRGLLLAKDRVYPHRTNYLEELKKFNANILISKDDFIVLGSEKVHPSTVNVSDLRGGLSILLLALSMKGRSTIMHTEILDRGYENLVNTLVSLGAGIKEDEE